jgi:hypothetical protein
LREYFRRQTGTRSRRTRSLLADRLQPSGKNDEIPARVEHIPTQTWHAEDWAAFIRSPKLDDDEGAGDDTLRRWREMTGRA